MIGFGQSDGALRVRRGAREKKREKKSRPTDASLRKPRNAQRGADPARAFSRAFRVCSDPRTAMSRAASALERAGESSCGVSHRGRGSRPEVASPPGPIARDSVALAGGKMENRTRGTSFPWRSVGGKHVGHVGWKKCGAPASGDVPPRLSSLPKLPPSRWPAGRLRACGGTYAGLPLRA